MVGLYNSMPQGYNIITSSEQIQFNCYNYTSTYIFLKKYYKCFTHRILWFRDKSVNLVINCSRILTQESNQVISQLTVTHNFTRLSAMLSIRDSNLNTHIHTDYSLRFQRNFCALPSLFHDEQALITAKYTL